MFKLCTYLYNAFSHFISILVPSTITKGGKFLLVANIFGIVSFASFDIDLYEAIAYVIHIYNICIRIKMLFIKH